MVSVIKGKPYFEENKEEIKKREKRFGKSLVFSNMLEAETGYILGVKEGDHSFLFDGRELLITQ